MLRCDPAGAVFQETLNDLSERDREAPPTGDAVIVFFGYNDMICGGSRGSKNVSEKGVGFFLWRGCVAKREPSREHIEEFGIIEGAVLLSERY